MHLPFLRVPRFKGKPGKKHTILGGSPKKNHTHVDCCSWGNGTCLGSKRTIRGGAWIVVLAANKWGDSFCFGPLNHNKQKCEMFPNNKRGFGVV